mgnify:CR=1 FL=1
MARHQISGNGIKIILDQYPLAGMEQIVDKSYEKDIINQKYDFIEEIIDEVLVNKAQKAASTERLIST